MCRHLTQTPATRRGGASWHAWCDTPHASCVATHREQRQQRLRSDTPAAQPTQGHGAHAPHTLQSDGLHGKRRTARLITHLGAVGGGSLSGLQRGHVIVRVTGISGRRGRYGLVDNLLNSDARHTERLVSETEGRGQTDGRF